MTTMLKISHALILGSAVPPTVVIVIIKGSDNSLMIESSCLKEFSAKNPGKLSFLF